MLFCNATLCRHWWLTSRSSPRQLVGWPFESCVLLSFSLIDMQHLFVIIDGQVLAGPLYFNKRISPPPGDHSKKLI
jgi:hypothetical protein